MELDEDNYSKAESALKDVLYVFVDAVVQDGDFSELSLGGFDPFDFLWVCGRSCDVVFMSDGEADLLMKGSAIVLLSKLADIYFDDECNATNEKDKLENGVMPNYIKKNGDMSLPEHYSYLSRIYEVYKNDLYIKDQYIKNAFVAAFTSEDEFYLAMREVLKYVIKPCFNTLAEFKS